MPLTLYLKTPTQDTCGWPTCLVLFRYYSHLGWSATEDVQRVDGLRPLRLVLGRGRPHQRRTEKGPTRQNAGRIFLRVFKLKCRLEALFSYFCTPTFGFLNVLPSVLFSLINNEKTPVLGNYQVNNTLMNPCAFSSSHTRS